MPVGLVECRKLAPRVVVGADASNYKLNAIIMKTSLLKHCLLLASFPALLWAQPAPATVAWTDSPDIAGVRELTFGGSGGSNRQLNDTFGGATASYGVYFNNEWLGSIRQSVNYSNPRGRPTTWNGSTRLALDYHFTTLGAAMPFVGASFGRIYGTSLRDTWSAGLEGGLKYYVQRKVFVFVMAEYNWLFQRTRELDNNFGSGQLYWTTGIGFNF